MHVKAKIVFSMFFESSSSSVTVILTNSTKFNQIGFTDFSFLWMKRINCTSLHYDPRMWSEAYESFEFMLYVATPDLCKTCFLSMGCILIL